MFAKSVAALTDAGGVKCRGANFAGQLGLGSGVRAIGAGIPKPEHVGSAHVLRHSGAIARLGETGNPKAVQDHLGHQDAAMTLRYFKTLQSAESLKIQKGVDFRW